MSVRAVHEAQQQAAPRSVMPTVVPFPRHRRVRNSDRRPREYLTEREVIWIMDAAAKRGRYGWRDRTMVLLAYRHGLRVSELVSLQWHQMDLDAAMLHVRRAKGSNHGVHPLTGIEIRALRRVKREQTEGSKFVFMTERGAPMSADGFAAMLSRAAASCNFPFSVHPHMLRHACGFHLASNGADALNIKVWLGHRQIQNTMVYCDLASARFDGAGFWKD